LQNQASTRRQGQIGGTVEDWGIAFEGLPLDSRLYPAVGLYQRDDRVTLLTVESSSRSAGRDGGVEISGGFCYYPLPDPVIGLGPSAAMAEVRQFNETLSWEGTQYVLEVLEYILECLEGNKDEFVVSTLLPSLSAALCLLPNSIPTLSEKFALTLLPHMSNFLLKLDGFLGERQQVQRLFRTGMRPGKWVIRATGSSGENSDYEEYVVDFTTTVNEQGATIGFEGAGVGTTGKSKNGLVAIFGTTKGSSVHFVEEWSDGSDEAFGSASTPDETSSCVVAARISLDGTKFEGTYRNVQFGTTGQIAGILQSDNSALAKLRLKDAPASSKQSAKLADGVVTGEGVLCLAFNHMATIIGEDAAGDQINDTDTANEEQMTSIRKLLSGQLLCGSSLESTDRLCEKPMDSLRTFYSWNNDFEDTHHCRHLEILESARLETSFKNEGADKDAPLSIEEIEKRVRELDDNQSRETGGKGSLRGRCPLEYDETRLKIICAFIGPCALHDDLRTCSPQLKLVWQAALKIIEDGFREALMANRESGKTQKQLCLEKCDLFNKISTFLGSLDRWDKISLADVTREMSTFYRTVRSASALDLLRAEIEAGARRSLLRLISVQEAVTLLTEIENSGRDVENLIGLEAIVLGLPRLLGRNQTDSLIRMKKPSLTRQENTSGNSNSVASAGSSRQMRLALRNNVHKLFHLLGRIAKKAVARRSQASSDEARMPADSLLLALLTFFTITLKDESIDEMVRGSGIIDIITELTSQSRDSISTGALSITDEKSSVVKKLQVICQREIFRSILRACVAATHALVFQVSHRGCGQVEEAMESTALCLELLFRELKNMCDIAEKNVKEALLVATTRRADGDWEKWCESFCSDSKKADKGSSNQPVGSAGLQYLHEHGTTHGCGLLASSQRSASRQKQSTSASSRASSDSLAKLQSGFVFELLSQWLHILCGILYSPISSSHLSSNSKWVSLLIWAVGLSADFKNDGSVDTLSRREQQEGLLPARFRSRILRFLLPLLDAMAPDEKIVVGLLCLAGQGPPSMTRAFDEDEKFASREAVTLLRQLHSPVRPAWRDCVNRVISLSGKDKVDSSDELVRKLGILSFFSGSLEAIGRGSYVLLKPAAAVPLSVDQQSSPSSKGHSSGVGGAGSGIGATPHHIVGNGTEGVVAGLCRHDASAGLVSNIDLKNGICEVVLLTRDPYGPDKTGDTLLLSKPPSGSAGPRHTLTVRALRTALSDVVHAQEAPLHLDEMMAFDNLFASMMEPALATMFAIMKPEASLVTLGSKVEGGDQGTSKLSELKLGVTNVSMAMMLLRSVIVILSDKRIAETFLRKENSKDILSRILRLAWPAETEKENLSDFVGKAQRSFLSSLPAHEARYGHLVSLLSDLSLRSDALAAISDEEWAKRLEELRVRRQAADEEKKKETSAAGGDNDESTPPSASDSGVAISQASGSGASSMVSGSVDADAAARTSEATNRAVSQSTMGSNSEEEEESEAAATAAAHLREAAIAQMAELGLPRSWSELALRRTGGNDIEAAVHFCLERGGEMERLLAEERERERLMQRQSGGAQSSRRRGYRGETGSSNHLLRQLLEMGFPSRWCAEALAATGNNVDEALTWILTHGERLSEEDEAMEEEDDGEDVDEEDDSNDDDDEDDDDAGGSVSAAEGTADATAATTKASKDGTDASAGYSEADTVWSGSVVPLRFISGRSIIDSKTLAISGLPTGGFSSVGTKGILLCSGKWYYEAILETAGCLQIGWADGSFAGHCHADRGDGTGDGPR
jgi:UBA/TS-N domain